MRKLLYIPVFAFCLLASGASGQTVMKILSGETFFIAGPATLTLEDVHLKNEGVLKTGSGSSTVLLIGSKDVSIEGSGSTQFNILHIQKAAVAELELGQDILVTGKLKMDGGLLDLNTYDITLEQPGGMLSDESETSRIYSSSTGKIELSADLTIPPAGVNLGALGVVISSASMGTTLVQRGHLPQGEACATGIQRYFNIEPASNSSLGATLRMYYFDAELQGIDETDLHLFRSDDNGLSWTDVGFDARNSTENWVEKTGISSMAMWTLGSDLTGTACLLQISGAILWEHDGLSGVKDAAVGVTGGATGSSMTDVNGDYAVSGLSGTGSFSIKPVKNINFYNGLAVNDALAIQRHVTGQFLLTDAFKIIAADVSGNKVVSTMDALLIKQGLLGNPLVASLFKSSWRFVPQSWTPVLPPWSFPEKMDLTGITTDQTDQDFYGVKIGDVLAGFADPANFGGNQGLGPLVLRVEDQLLEAGQSHQLAFTADAFDDLAAWQFALRFDPLRIHFDSLEIDANALEISPDDFGLWNIDEGAIRAVWSQNQGVDIPNGAEVFRLHFTALSSGKMLSEVLVLDDTVLPGAAFDSDLKQAGVALSFGGLTSAQHPTVEQYMLLQNRPNPFSTETTIEFVLPDACKAQLRVLDVTGRELIHLDKAFVKGYNAEKIQLGEESASGVLYYELTTPFGVRTKRMLRIMK